MNQGSLHLTGGFSLPKPLLMLAPMEGLTNSGMRDLIIGCRGVDTVATEFIRITSPNQTIKSFKRHSVTLQIQLMASEPEILSQIIVHLKTKGVLEDNDWVDLNVGCPSRRVNSHGAGAALLKDPPKLLSIIHSMRAVHKNGPLSVKTRLGFESSDEFPELLQYLKDAPLDLITFHARSKCAAYDAEQLETEKLALAAETLPYPVIGNGDIDNVEKALSMLRDTGVAGCMIGRGAITNPYLFHDIKAALNGDSFELDPEKRTTELYRFAVGYLRFLQEKETQVKRPQIGPFKEFATWFSRNPLIGREFFGSVKRLSDLDSVTQFLETKTKLGTTPKTQIFISPEIQPSL